MREMMHAELRRGDELLKVWEALNDVVVAKGTIARMADFRVEIDSQLVATFRADGIIISTPTGSTAYNLAANGPIVMPNISATVITPICPHLLTLRPIVVPSSSTVCVHVVGVPNETYLTVDGQEAVNVQLGDHVHCRRSEYSVRLLRHQPNGLVQRAAVEVEVGRAVGSSVLAERRTTGCSTCSGTTLFRAYPV